MNVKTKYSTSNEILFGHFKTIIKKDTCTLMFTAALFTIARPWKQPRCSATDQWIKKLYIYPLEYYSAI